jgi:hypothetical protein
MWIIFSKFLTPKKFTAIVIFPFLITRENNISSNAVMINHEKIHFRQIIELFVLPFYLWYGIEFLIRLFQYKNKRQAYLNICFEREAYTNEKDLNYLKKRSLWGFRGYLQLVNC